MLDFFERALRPVQHILITAHLSKQKPEYAVQKYIFIALCVGVDEAGVCVGAAYAAFRSP